MNAYFDAEKIEHLRILMTAIREGRHQDTIDQFVEEIARYISQTRENVEEKVFGEASFDSNRFKDAANNALEAAIKQIELGSIKTWDGFDKRYQALLEQELKAFILPSHETLNERHNRLPAKYEDPDKPNSEEIQKTLYERLTPSQATAVRAKLETGDYRTDDTNSNAAATRYYSALERLREPDVRQGLETLLYGADKPKRKSSLKKPIFRDVWPDPMRDTATPSAREIIGLKRIIRSYLADEDGNLDCKKLAEESGFSAEWLETITDVTNSRLPEVRGYYDSYPYPRRLNKVIGSEEDQRKFGQALAKLSELNRTAPAIFFRD